MRFLNNSGYTITFEAWGFRLFIISAWICYYNFAKGTLTIFELNTIHIIIDENMFIGIFEWFGSSILLFSVFLCLGWWNMRASISSTHVRPINHYFTWLSLSQWTKLKNVNLFGSKSRISILLSFKCSLKNKFDVKNF